MSEKKSIDDKLSDALDIPVVSGEIIEKPKAEIEKPTPSIKDIELNQDYQRVRGNLKDIIESGSIALEGILTVAAETESPRAYEVAAQIIKNVADVNKDLIEMHNKMKNIQKESGNQSAGSITNNTLFVGSTKDLQKFIKDQRDMIVDQIEHENESD